MFERIPAEGPLLALLLSDADDPSETTFPTPDDLNLQVGFVVYKNYFERFFHSQSFSGSFLAIIGMRIVVVAPTSLACSRKRSSSLSRG